ncbi:MAG TPA: helix-turn-helix domain-containing protein [Cytophagales bacterium]|nr:helix-turn-helix domain-containing protein [Cytophagales bacterium]
MYTEEEYTRLAGEGELIGQWAFVFSVLVLLLFVYWLASVQLLIKFSKEKEKVLSYHQNVTFLATFLGAAFISYLVGILFSLHYFFGIELFSFTGMNLGWIILPILTYSISWFALIQPDAMRVSYHEKKKTVSRMQDKALAEYKIRLEALMRQEKLYLNPLLKLNEVAEKLQLDTTRLSWLINEGYGCNFYDFVNQYRIDAFIQKINNKEHKHHTLLALAYETGFNSKTTFNKSFKNYLKITPSAYVKKMNSTEHFSLSLENKANHYTVRSQNSKSESTSI